MADAPRQPRPDLTGDLDTPESMGFFELLRRLETTGHRFGRSGGPSREPARLGQRVRLSMATRDVAGFRPGTDTRPAEVDVEVLGLFGPEGALPLHLTRWVMARLSDRWFAGNDDRETSDTAFLDFANMLQHRLLALYWRAWADPRPEVQTELTEGGRVVALIGALAGIGLPGAGATEDDGGVEGDHLRRRHATALGVAVNQPERLTHYVADVIGAPVVLREFVGEWLDIPVHLQTRLGREHCGLGRSAVVGGRSFQRQGRAELRIGPVGLQTYLAIASDSALRRRVARAVRFASGCSIDFDLRPVLARAAIPDPRIGACRLGLSTWISPRRTRDADDLRLARITAASGQGSLAA